MKNRLPHHVTKGFTLIEILTVITIIAMLAALGFGGFKAVNDKAARRGTTTRLSALKLKIEEFKIDNGEYPKAPSTEDKTEVKGTSWPAGGARLLYQVVTGDGDNAIEGGGTSSTGVLGSSGKVYWDEVVPPTAKEIQNKKPKPMVAVTDSGSYYMIDGYRKPFQYVKAIKDRNRRTSNVDELHSTADFEIWSFGTLDAPLTDPQSQKEWITSWGNE